MKTSAELQAAYDNARTGAEAFVAKQLELLDPNDEKLRDRLYRMIDYAIKRFDWYEEQRFKFLQIGLAFVTVSAGLSGFLGNVRQSLPTATLGCSLVAVGVVLITGATLIWQYNQLRGVTYPYRKIADIRSWFFFYNFQDLPSALSDNEEESIEQVAKTAEAYKTFVKRWSEYASDSTKSIAEDLQQVFILQLLQHYRRESLESMNRTLSTGLVFFIASSVLALVSFLTLK